MKYGLLVCALLLVACGARTELDPFTPDGSTGDAGTGDAGPGPDPTVVGPGITIGLFSGDTANDGTNWMRPFTCAAEAEFGDLHPYSVVTFENPTVQDLRVEILVDWDFDGFLHVYQSPFRPESLDTGCLGANDDFGGTGQSRLTGILVPAGESIDLVLSSFTPGASGRYDAFITTE